MQKMRSENSPTARFKYFIFLVHLVGHGIAVEDGQTVVGVIPEAAVGSIGDVARRIVGEGLFRENFVVQILHGSLDDSVEFIISITHFFVFGKYFYKKTRPEKPPAVLSRYFLLVKSILNQLFGNVLNIRLIN